MVVLSEKGLYRLIMRSNKPKAESFQDWVYDTLKMLREASGLEGYQIFRMLDKEHQLESMRKLREGMRAAEQVDYIRANTIANKAVSNAFGHAKLVKKDDMTPEMLAQREPILEDVVSLMAVNDRYALGLSVSKLVYGKYCLEGEDP